MKNFKRALLALCFISIFAMLGFLFYNYSTSKTTVVNFELSAHDGLTDIYTIEFSDGSTSQFSVKNGKDALDIHDVYEAYKEEHGAEFSESHEGQELTFEEFLKIFLTFEQEENQKIVVSRLLNSCFKVLAQIDSDLWSLGSGVIYEMDDDTAYIVTNFHVVYTGKTLSGISDNIVLLPYGTESQYFSCEYVYGAADLDLAVLKIDADTLRSYNENVCAVTLADNYSVGETAIAIGNALGEGIAVSKGVVWVENETISVKIKNEVREYRCMRIDTPIYEGNSGGGLFNSDGELIGITNAGDGEHEHMNYAIPINIVRPAIDSIIFYDKDNNILTSGVYKLVFGVTLAESNSRYVYDPSTGGGKICADIVVDYVSGGSLSEKMGLQKGDIIKKFYINDIAYEINRNFNIGDLAMAVRAGDSIKFEFEREGSTHFTTGTEDGGYVVRQTDLTTKVS